MDIFIVIICFSICVISGVISIIYAYKMVNVLNNERVPTYGFEFMFSYNKFRKFIETCSDNENKIRYANLYIKSSFMRKFYILSFIFSILVLYILDVIKYI